MDTELLRPYLADPHSWRRAHIVLATISVALLLVMLGAAVVAGLEVNLRTAPDLVGPFRWTSLEEWG